MAEIEINGTILHYDEELLSHENIKPITAEDANATLQLTCKLMSQIGLKTYLCFGTLLGAVRDRNFIKGDEDVDVYVESEEILCSNISRLYENGLKLIRVIPKRVYSFRYIDGCYIDIYVFQKNVRSIWGKCCYYLNGWAMPKRYFQNEMQIEFLGEKYYSVTNPEDLLAFWYGKNWRVPVRGHKFIYEVRSAYLWHNKKRLLKSFVQKAIGWYHWRHLIKSEYRQMK